MSVSPPDSPSSPPRRPLWCPRFEVGLWGVGMLLALRAAAAHAWQDALAYLLVASAPVVLVRCVRFILTPSRRHLAGAMLLAAPFGLVLALALWPWAFGYGYPPDYPAGGYVQSNAHTVQTMLESYGGDHGGRYPPSVASLYGEAVRGNYWKAMRNPYAGKMGVDIPALTDCPRGGLRDGQLIPGAVYYELSAADQTTYYVYGADSRGLLIRDKDRPFVLSNS